MRPSALSALLVAPAVLAAASAPPVVSWRDAAAHVGQRVVVEGTVVGAERTGRHLTLRFHPSDPMALRVTLVIPLFTDLPSEPEHLYHGRRLHVRGRIQRAAGRLSLIVTDPAHIEVVGFTDPSPSAPPAAAADGSAAPPCAGERTAWEAARTEALEATRTVQRCLASGEPGCGRTAAPLATALTRLEWAEQRVRRACAGEAGASAQ